jgi:hypothetical protein
MFLVTSVIEGIDMYHGERETIAEALELMGEVAELYSDSNIIRLTMLRTIDWGIHGS